MYGYNKGIYMNQTIDLKAALRSGRFITAMPHEY
jgi:hypothetical protein